MRRESRGKMTAELLREAGMLGMTFGLLDYVFAKSAERPPVYVLWAVFAISLGTVWLGLWLEENRED